MGQVTMSETIVEAHTFPDELIDRIAGSIDVSDPQKMVWLAYHLRDIAADVKGYKLYKVIRNPSKLKRAFAQTVKDCDRLLRTLSTEPEDIAVAVSNMPIKPYRRLLLWEIAARNPEINPARALDDGTADKIFAEHIGSINAIREAAVKASDSISDRVASGRGGARHQRDRALDEVLQQLIQLYEEVTGSERGSSYSFKAKEADGPLVRYLELCLAPLGWPLSRDAIRGHLRRMDDDRRS